MNSSMVQRQPSSVIPPEGSGAPASGRPSWASGWQGRHLRARLKAAAVHLGLSLAIALAVLALVYGFWYQDALAGVAGVGTILVLLLAVDVCLGPIMTLLVFDRRKKSLPMDLALIGLMQMGALAYGLHTVELGRPHYLVFVKDRFEAVSHADLQAEDRAAAVGNASARTHWWGPAWVAAKAPDSEARRQEVLMESVLGGRDLQHFPQWYEPLSSQQAQIRARALPLAELRRLNPEAGSLLDGSLKTLRRSEAQVGYLPVKGEAGDASVLVDRQDGRVLGLLALRPWS